MTAPAIQASVWTGRRWWLLIALTFCAQLALIFSLGDRSAPRVRRPFPAPRLGIVEGSSRELVALMDPTLFALPHAQGFSGPAWMRIPAVPSRSFEWTEDPRWLALSVERLAKHSEELLETSPIGVLNTLASFEPELTSPEPSFATSFSQKSTFRLGEGLARRRLKTLPELPSWPHADILTNTVVKLLIDGTGVSVSTPVLLSSSGLKAADDYALAQASAAQFEPIVREGPGRIANALGNLTWGTMIFQWRTLPLSATNGPSPNLPK